MWKTIIVILFFILMGFRYIDGYILLGNLNYLNNSLCSSTEIFHKTDKILWCMELRENWTHIRDEYIDYCKSHALNRFKNIDSSQDLIDIGDKNWFVVFLNLYGTFTKLASHFPKTCALLNKIPGCTLAMFSTIEGGKVIPEHCGPYNGVLRYHLCLLTDKENPEKCYIVVNKVKYFWKEGSDVLFDDFYLHHVVNDTPTTRVVLFLDIRKEFANSFVNQINTLFFYMSDGNITKESMLAKINQFEIKK